MEKNRIQPLLLLLLHLHQNLQFKLRPHQLSLLSQPQPPQKQRNPTQLDSVNPDSALSPLPLPPLQRSVHHRSLPLPQRNLHSVNPQDSDHSLLLPLPRLPQLQQVDSVGSVQPRIQQLEEGSLHSDPERVQADSED